MSEFNAVSAEELNQIEGGMENGGSGFKPVPDPIIEIIKAIIKGVLNPTPPKT